MRCAWQAYLNLLPTWMRQAVDKQGRDTLQELRLRIGQPPQLVSNFGNLWLEKPVTREDLNYCINSASRYSPWSANTSANGYITAPGGHRLGVCGQATISKQGMTGISIVNSICLRVARDFPGIARKAVSTNGSVLIIGKPGCGKTTLLRDLIREKSNLVEGSVAVVDERGELFPYVQDKPCFPPGNCTDILTGCPKVQGIESVLRSMGPSCIAVDEITAAEDCEALTLAGWCGVTLLATAHAGNKQDLFQRPVYAPLVKSGLFQTLLVLHSDKSYGIERMAL